MVPSAECSTAIKILSFQCGFFLMHSADEQKKAKTVSSIIHFYQFGNQRHIGMVASLIVSA